MPFCATPVPSRRVPLYLIEARAEAGARDRRRRAARLRQVAAPLLGFAAALGFLAAVAGAVALLGGL